ncbi:hypothetical protein DFQ28_006648 [Apophysomyces sp. BC1034]|nr:hypothetical protein DFQ30_004683 [Apophysomyces sp. BC1015]KAG0182545.1 hypothetical protein DFQ29_003547 [Apophysomyces sp. BC1021]KAG0193054.1 hypothetical protein DFQ28_006648 [Apophysomyces sp. BC1034]
MKNSSSSYDNYQKQHRQHESPSIYQGNDPYRAVRKSHRTDSTDSGREVSELEAAHSRTASDSSTSRLATNAITAQPMQQVLQRDLYTNYDCYDDDPYAIPGVDKKKNRTRTDPGRANSYLPYSHHQRDPFQPATPIYIEEPLPTPCREEGGVGSMLQDDLVMDMDQPSPCPPVPAATHRPSPDPEILSEIKKKRPKKRYCCGLRLRTIILVAVLFAAVTGTVWFFVWPRVPHTVLDSIDMIKPLDPSNTTLSISTTWKVSMKIDNEMNWIPTPITNIAITVLNSHTGVTLGRADSGPMELAPRHKWQAFSVPMNISYSTNKATDPTFKNLYDACGVQIRNLVPSTKQEALQITFQLTYKIAGIAWATTRDIPSPDGIKCPRDLVE